jgi:O-antigen polymerase
MLTKWIINTLIALTLAVTLLNSNAFGSSSLIAYFFYCILANFTAVIIFFVIAMQKKYHIKRLPIPIIIFVTLTLYVALHGLISNNIGLVHYYWFTNCIFLLSLFLWIRYQIMFGNNPVTILYSFIVALAILESLVVLSQFFGLLPVANNFFKCTGTWSNPNVTAIFLSLSLFAVVNNQLTINKYINYIVMAVIVFAILFLECRTAFVISLILILFAFKKQIVHYFLPNAKSLIAGYFIIVFVVAIQIYSLAFTGKTASTSGRLYIWDKTTEVIIKKPLTGYGFGLFEKEYNSYISLNPNKKNEHVNMPYNDYFEITVEGGITATILWVAFVISLIVFDVKNNTKAKSLIPIIISFMVLQLMNFGFQAIPAMVLFLLYGAIICNAIENNTTEISVGFNFNRIILFSCMALALTLLVKNFSLCAGFYQKWQISIRPINRTTLVKFVKLESILKNQTSYHENFADILGRQKKYGIAIKQYKMALATSSDPDIFGKTAYCYQMEKQYDSSEYYYNLMATMQPSRLIPKLAILKLYEEKKDTLLIITKATEIKNAYVKIKNAKAYGIKAYADSILKSVIPAK